MDRTHGEPAKDMLARLSEHELAAVLYRYGQERWAKRIARHIVRSRQQQPVQRTTELAGLVAEAIPRRYYPSKIHPATKTFQALRIAVNDELASIEKGLDSALELVRPGGRICAIAFHSLEDGIVKNRFRDWEKACRCPSSIPVCVCNGRPRLRVVTRKPVAPSARERDANPSARSARLRVGERV
jgi:16S rRNA (cytosine1402-N4)-methyltransferase